MKRIVLIIGLALVFGLGIFAGATLSPTAHATPPTNEELASHAPDRDAAARGTLVYQDERVAILVMPAPDEVGKTLVLRIDKHNSITYNLERFGNEQYRWNSIL